MKKNSNKCPASKPSNIQTLHKNESEYDLEANFRRVNSYNKGKRTSQRRKGGLTETQNEEYVQSERRYVDGSVDTSPQTYSGGTSWENYWRLEDKISNFNDKNDKAHIDLRRELEQKIKETSTSLTNQVSNLDTKVEARISRQTFYWVIGGLVGAAGLIVSLWWMFSYSQLINLPDRISDIEKSNSFIIDHSSSIDKSDTLHIEKNK